MHLTFGMLRHLGLTLALIAPLAAQVAAPAGGQPASSAANGVIPILPNLSRTVENTRVDLAHLRIDKWKTNGDGKQDAQSRVQAMQRNMTDALPALIAAARQNPQSSNAAFKLYRNVNVLYDVMSNLAESAGAFGPKDEYGPMARDLGELDQERRALGNALESLTAQTDAQIAHMQQAVRQAQVESAPAKKLVIDDTTPEKPEKKTTRKTTTKKKSAPPPQQ